MAVYKNKKGKTNKTFPLKKCIKLTNPANPQNLQEYLGNPHPQFASITINSPLVSPSNLVCSAFLPQMLFGASVPPKISKEEPPSLLFSSPLVFLDHASMLFLTKSANAQLIPKRLKIKFHKICVLLQWSK